MATGYYDANGIWQYGESDPIALFSDLLNLGQDSTSDQFTNDRARISFLEQSVEQASTFVASSSASRDSYWGVPATSATQLALQNKGARTVRTDLGYTEQYFAAYNVSTNPGGRSDGAGWYKTTRQTGMFAQVPGFVTAVTGTATTNDLGTVTFSGCTVLYLGGIFNTTYKRYVIHMTSTASVAATNIYTRFMAGGTTYAAGYYGGSLLIPYSGALVGDQQKSGGTEGAIGLSGAGGTVHILDVYPGAGNPQYNYRATSAPNANSYFGGYNLTGGITGIDGMYFAPASGNFTGQVTVYGVND